ncbi:BNR-repeat neuraminidase N-terminal domain-containing protein [Fulvivirgaceae bacterium BMA10]|uniref:BNR-repeat neuraminidase N-terminal domain-containing protein n=1 Tax=Splendidivirga corallicola TaxID=3051826 RepID=A0ABT8KGV8_9BACT|nr:BNR-repeat neuraminidase N-terminal domain-containing protein [Fulvivirgaceae bacterium BMA10]
MRLQITVRSKLRTLIILLCIVSGTQAGNQNVRVDLFENERSDHFSDLLGTTKGYLNLPALEINQPFTYEEHRPIHDLDFTTGGPDNYGYTYIDSDEPSGTVAFEDISGTGTDISMGDEGEFNTTLPFEFDFYGTVSRDVRIGGNGAIRFSQTSGNISYNNRDFPRNSPPLLIAPFWDDLNVDSGGAVYMETKGTAPNRRFIVQWHQIPHYDLSSSNTITFQVVMYEGYNNIDFVYQDAYFGDSDYDHGESATIGINEDASDALKYSFKTNSLDGITSIRYTHPSNSTSMSYTSSDLFQTITSNVAPGDNGQKVIELRVVVNGNRTPFDITSFSLNTNGTSDPNNDIYNAVIYYSGNGPNFSKDVIFGSESAPNGPFAITGSQSLVTGNNYFWLTYNIKEDATGGNVVDAECNQVVVGGINRVPSTTAPTGSRTISSTIPDASSCANAKSVSGCGNISVTGNTSGGDTSNYGNCGTSSNTHEKHWYVLEGNGTEITAETIDISDPDLDDTKIWVFSGSCGSTTCIDGDDDSGPGYYSKVTFTAEEGETYYILVGGYDSGDVGNYQLDITTNVNCMSYTSSTVSQNTNNLSKGVEDQQVIGIEIVTSNSLDPLDVTSFTFNTTGTTNTADITNAKVYYTGTNNTFATGELFGDVVASPNGSFVINDTQQLSEGTNYFWLTYDINASATKGNAIDAECTQITVDGTNRTPTVTAPGGDRKISGITPLRANALSFDGGDYVTFTGYKGITGSNDRTIEAWIKTSTSGPIISWGNNTSGSDWTMSISSSGYLRTDVGGGHIEGDTDLRDDSWHHIAVSFTGSNITDGVLYVDGTPETLSSSSGQTVNTASSADVVIGQDHSSNYFTGEIDEVRIWSVSRSQNEIRENLHLTLLGSESNLSNYWQFNEASGTTISDAQVGGNNGILGDGVTSSTYPARLTSTVAIGGGISYLQNVNATGIVNFGSTGATLNFTSWSGGAEDVVISKITGESAPGNDPKNDVPILADVHAKYWIVRKFGSGSFSANVTLALGSGTVSVDDATTPSNLRLLKRSSNSYGTWVSSEEGDAAMVASGEATFDGVTGFSQLMLGTIGNSPLPVTWLSFEAVLDNGKVHLDWKTASEINNDFFEIQRSEDGRNFEVIGSVNGNGTVNEISTYSFTDKTPLFGGSLYRLRQIDFDGQFDFSNVVAIDNPFTGRQLEVTVYPNPTDQHNINIRVATENRQNEVLVELFDISGVGYLNETFDPGELTSDRLLNPAKKIKSGIYILVVKQNGQTYKEKIIIV